eukprot:TRINITY_DN1069_c0_g1_i3.p1 TRINITY_DN1069_c0_g1~~TRINITY_DN1069_c0_g1_i3.p1  ORF type:complete len:382 (+),score=75.35 TRINITY_DN1069_c0_g1_i3:324-1469(+)
MLEIQPYPDEYTPIYISLIYEEHMQEKSHWSGYIAMLPETVSNTLYYEPELLEYLKGTYLYYETKRVKEKLREIQTFIRYYSDKFDPSIYTYDALVWAYSMFWSRALYVLKNGIHTEALVPLADILNHDNGSSAYWDRKILSERSDLLKLNSGVKVYNGEEVCLNYGAKGNCELLLHYGFTQEYNVGNCLKIYFECFEEVLVDKVLIPPFEIFREIKTSELEGYFYIYEDSVPVDLIVSMRKAFRNKNEASIEDGDEKIKGFIYGSKNIEFDIHDIESYISPNIVTLIGEPLSLENEIISIINCCRIATFYLNMLNSNKRDGSEIPDHRARINIQTAIESEQKVLNGFKNNMEKLITMILEEHKLEGNVKEQIYKLAAEYS